MNRIEMKKCKNCGEKYPRLKEANNSGRGIKDAKVRPKNCVTCSRKCSREYNR